MPTNLYCPRCRAAYPANVSYCLEDGAKLFERELVIWIDQHLGPYHVRELIGAGESSVIYRAEHYSLDRPVALKMLRPERAAELGSADEVFAEARNIASVGHDNIVDVTDFGTTSSGLPYFVMELLEGHTLDVLVEREGPLRLLRAVTIVRQVASALAAVHRAGIVHRDLVPDNVFITERESRRRVVQRLDDDGTGSGDRVVIRPEGTIDFVKLLDFGIAKPILGAPGPATRAGVLLGDVRYIAPERARGLPVDARTDVYALGVLFYQLITGVVPFDGETHDQVIAGHLYGRVVPPAVRRTPVKIDRVTNLTVLKCLQKDPEARFQSMDELEAGLRDCFSDEILLSEVERLGQRAGIIEAVDGGLEDVPTTAFNARPERLSAELANLFIKHDDEKLTPAELEAASQVSTREVSLTIELAELFRGMGSLSDP
ncbi:MAG: serine/threonine protein kinase [Myxococcales bacterium]|nr:serine/threonine protein kinase [Myxococcales bacterium]